MFTGKMFNGVRGFFTPKGWRGASAMPKEQRDEASKTIQNTVWNPQKVGSRLKGGDQA